MFDKHAGAWHNAKLVKATHCEPWVWFLHAKDQGQLQEEGKWEDPNYA